jgi:ribosomal protein L40E
MYKLNSMLNPILKKLAQHFNCDKMMCRKCYTRLNKIANNNSRKCSSSDLRLKRY